MTHRYTKAAVLVLMAFLLFTLIAVAAITFKFSPVKIPGAHASWAYGVNNSGVIVGQYFDANYVGHGFKLHSGTWTRIDPPGSTETICYGINSTGAVVGEYTDQSNSNHGFLYQNGTFSQIGEGSQSAAGGINDQGDIVGDYLGSDGLQHAFLWDGQKYTQLDVPNAQSTGAVGINKQGAIALVAFYYGPPARSFLYEQGKFTEIKVPGATQTYLSGVNNLGDLALTWDDAKGIHGGIRYQGVFYKFDYTPDYTNVYGLNDHHIIVGDSFTSTAFKATFSTSTGVTTDSDTQ
jgi:probable HAF family extracellular repeat protein